MEKEKKNIEFVARTLEAERMSKDKKILLDIIILVISIILMKYTGNASYVYATVFFVFFNSFDFWDSIVMIYACKMGKERKLASYRAAGNMVVNAYNQLGRIPTIEEARKFSKFSSSSLEEFQLYKVLYFNILCVELALFSNKHPFIYVIVVLITSIFFLYYIGRIV